MRYVVRFDESNEFAPYLVVDTLTGCIIESYRLRANAESLKDYLNNVEDS